MAFDPDKELSSGGKEMRAKSAPGTTKRGRSLAPSTLSSASLPSLTPGRRRAKPPSPASARRRTKTTTNITSLPKPRGSARIPRSGRSGRTMSALSIGNVTRYRPQLPIMSPENPKMSTALEFDANFEAGNLGRVDGISGTEYDLFVRPDTRSPQHRLWFHFAVLNPSTQRQRVLLNVINLSKQKSLFSEGMTPVIGRGKPESRHWERMSRDDVKYDKSVVHEDRYILAMSVEFDAKESVEIAYNFPYPYSALLTHLRKLTVKTQPILRVDTLAKTLQGRRLDLVTVTSLANLVGTGKQRIIFLTARVHPGESPSSFVVQGLLDFLLGSSSEAAKLRERYVWKIIPMLNPDGVALGNYRCSLMGFDLNRHWQTPSSWAHPTLHAAKRTLLQYNRNHQMELVMYVDMHAHSTRYGAFLYGNVYSKDATRCERQLTLPLLMAETAEDFNLDATNFNTDAGKSGTGRRTMGGSLTDSALCYTLEVSFHGYRSSRPGAKVDVVPYTPQLCTHFSFPLFFPCSLWNRMPQFQTRDWARTLPEPFCDSPKLRMVRYPFCVGIK